MFNTPAETDKALDIVRRLADEFNKYGVAVEKTIGLAAKVAQMGNTGKALEAQVTQATRLSILGGMEQEAALDTTISLTNAFGISIEELANKINFLNAAENQTILAIEDFNTAIPLAGSVVRQLGGDVEDLAFFLTAMREGGINASQAGNALKSSLGRLIAPSRNAKETMSSFGIDVLGIVEGNAGDLKGTVLTLAQALDQLDPLSRARGIEALFGKFQFARMSTLLQNIVKEGSQANKVLQLTTATSEELQVVANRELKAVEDSPAFKLQKAMEHKPLNLILNLLLVAIVPLTKQNTEKQQMLCPLGLMKCLHDVQSRI
jgi:TP901 family phage tail tape measure protein